MTAFEVFEHFLNPLQDIKRLLSISTNILFSTHVLPSHRIPPKSWWYFGFDHGQHVGFYGRDTLTFLANRFGLHYIPVAKDLHLFSAKKISSFALRLISKLSHRGLSYYVKRRNCRETETDLEHNRSLT